MKINSLDMKIQNIKDLIGTNSTLIIKKFKLGKPNPLNTAIIYMNALAVKDIIDRDILKPLMFNIEEDLNGKQNLLQYISETYLPVCNTEFINDINKAVDEIKRGKTILIADSCEGFLMSDTTGGYYRSIAEPLNESTVRGSREGFVENLEANVSMIRRRIKDKNLVVEFVKIGRRTQTDLAIIYIKDIADINVVNQLKQKIATIDIDKITATGILEQYLSGNKYNIFPEFGATERSDKTAANLNEGRIALMLDGTPDAITAPSLFTEFFQTSEDYNQRLIPSSLLRFLRILCFFIVISLDAFYVALIGGNNEFIPLPFVFPIAQVRQNVSLSIFAGVLLMEIIVELIREGGLRLPSKIAQTISVVGGIIIGDAVVQAKIVGPATLFIVGVTTVSSFLINNYDMSLAARFLRFPMIILGNIYGLFGIAAGWFLIFTYLCSLSNLGVPYFSFKLSDMKDTFVRLSLFDMQKRPEAIPNINPTRQADFENKIKEDSDEQ
jgi:branched-subunit amino acid transport protein AzlD